MRVDESARAIAGGFTLVELLVSLALFALATAALAGMMIQASRVNKAHQLRTDVQSNASSCLALVLQDLRNAGWDPMNVGLDSVRMPATQSDSIEIFADINEDGDVDDPDETVEIRRVADRLEWRRSVGGAWETLALNITNDADGDGTAEPMFESDATLNPSRVTVRITARSPIRNLRSGDYVRHTAAARVAIRKTL